MNTKQVIKLHDKARSILDLIESCDAFIANRSKDCDRLVYRFPEIVKIHQSEIEFKKQVKKRLESYYLNTLKQIQEL